ncbi:MAG TPA: alcohol dehydrogenase [Pusillimonas sp.]|nr:alcohol dehydrogenase [Pusillimonas sp.]
MKIQAAVCRTTGGPLSIEGVDLESPQDDEILVRVVASGICQTDIGMCDSPTRVPKPIVLGHEGSGVVEKVGNQVTKVRTGDHVVMTFNSCGHCYSCYRGDVAYCYELNASNFSGQRKDGTTALSQGGEVIHSHFFNQSAFATYALCSERNVVPVQKDIPLELLGPLGCGIQTGAGAVINSLRVAPGSVIGIFGTGAVGLAAIMAAKVCGAAVIIAVDTKPARLDMALELGATHVINAFEKDTFTVLRNLAPRGMDYALDTSGNLQVIHDAVHHLAARGVCGLVNTAKGADMNANILQMVLGGRSVRGIHQGDSVPEIFISQLIQMYMQGRFPFDKLVRFYELSQINDALTDLQRGEAIKPIVRMPRAA